MIRSVRLGVVLFCFLSSALPGLAERSGAPVPLRGGFPSLPAILADTTAEWIAKKPASFLEDMTTLIASHGTGGEIDRKGLEDAVSVARARVRARELHRFAVADLNGDGAVTRREVHVAIAANAARSKARLILGHKAADADANGLAEPAEIAQFAESTVEREIGHAHARRLMELMSMDIDGSGAVSIDEVIDAIAAVQGAQQGADGAIILPSKSARSGSELPL